MDQQNSIPIIPINLSFCETYCQENYPKVPPNTPNSITKNDIYDNIINQLNAKLVSDKLSQL